MFNEYPDVLDVKQTANALGICEKSVYKLIHSGVIGYKQLGRIYRIPKSCLIAYVQSAQYQVRNL